MKRYSLLLLLFTSLVLSACSGDEPDEEVVAETPAKEDVKKEETKQSKLDHLNKISIEVTEESLIGLEPGSMMTDLTYDKDIEDIGFNTPELDPDLKNKLPAKLEELANETDDLETIKIGLVSMLASPHYKEIIENATLTNLISRSLTCQTRQKLKVARKQKLLKKQSFFWMRARACFNRRTAESKWRLRRMP